MSGETERISLASMEKRQGYQLLYVMCRKGYGPKMNCLMAVKVRRVSNGWAQRWEKQTDNDTRVTSGDRVLRLGLSL
jgi:hypothetical protein